MPYFLCPNCRQPLAEEALGATCPNGHRFDRAREGYLHLLPAGRHGRRPGGDDAAMLAARRAFLDAGHYRPVIDAVATAVAGARPSTVLDAGCGEGTYLAAATARCGAAGWGIDVAKPAVRLAARRHHDLRFAVASSFHLPFEADALAAAMVVFAPRDFAELHRVVRPGGRLVVASPGPDHLAGLRARLYADPRPHTERPHVRKEGDAAPTHRERVRFELSLDDPTDVTNLLQMTPYWWTARPDQQAAASEGGLTTMVDVWVTGHAAP